MTVSLTGLFHLVLMGLTEHVFGNMIITTTFLMMVLIVFGLLIRIPIPFALVIPLPLIIVLTAYGYMTVLVGGIVISTFLVMSVVSFLVGLGLKN